MAILSRKIQPELAPDEGRGVQPAMAFLRRRHLIFLLAGAGPLTFSGCGHPPQVSQDELDRQIQRYETQLAKVDEHFAKTDTQLEAYDAQLEQIETQNERMERLLDKWEEQAKRYDALLDRWEKEEAPPKR